MTAVTLGAVRTALASSAWAAVHSLLATTASKDLVERIAGARARNGLYRPAYNAVALATFGLLVWYVRRQPGRTMYHVRGATAGVLRLGQAAALLYMAWGVLQVGIGGLSGMPNLLSHVSGRRSIAREPEGQTPSPTRMAGSLGGVRASPFNLTRQAVNFFLLPLLWLNPRMTSRLAAFNGVATVYLFLGSLHSEHRLRRAYGPAYDDAYRRRGVPFFLPRIAPRGLLAGAQNTPA